MPASFAKSLLAIAVGNQPLSMVLSPKPRNWLNVSADGPVNPVMVPVYV
jgi:hypothetical protein